MACCAGLGLTHKDYLCHWDRASGSQVRRRLGVGRAYFYPPAYLLSSVSAKEFVGYGT